MQDAKKILEFSSDVSDNVIDITEATRSLNQQYYGEKENIIKEFGSLEDMRMKLGFTKSQIAKLLLVKPATWSRWEKNPSKAPPHIFQAVKWYTLLSGTNPNFRAQSAPEFLYENQLRLIGTELKKIKSDSALKTEFMDIFENKMSSVLNQGLSQIQVQIQPVINAQPAVAPVVQTVQMDESIKHEQFKIQTQVQNVEYLIRQLRDDMSSIRYRESAPQSHAQAVAPKKSEETKSTEAKILAALLGFLGFTALAAIAYFFVMYS